MRKVIHAGILVIILMIVAYGGLTIYGNVKAINDNPFSVPDVEKAAISIRVKNTGLTLFADDAKKTGSIIVINSSYWELIGNKYKLRKESLILDEAVFGPIELRERH